MKSISTFPSLVAWPKTVGELQKVLSLFHENTEIRCEGEPVMVLCPGHLNIVRNTTKTKTTKAI